MLRLPDGELARASPEVDDRDVSGRFDARATAPYHASRPRRRRRAGRRKPPCSRRGGNGLDPVRRLSARGSDDRLDFASSFLARGPRECLGNASRLLDLPRSDSPERMHVVTESEVPAVALELADALAGDRRDEKPGGVRADVDDADDDGRAGHAVGRLDRRGVRGRDVARA